MEEKIIRFTFAVNIMLM